MALALHHLHGVPDASAVDPSWSSGGPRRRLPPLPAQAASRCIA